MAGGVSKLKAIIKVCRPHQWTKNMIVWAPILFAGRITEPVLVARVAGCMASMCLMSSAIYVLNDLLDREADKLHPEKKNRPIAAGKITTFEAVVLCILLAELAVVISYFVRPSLILVIFCYLTIMVAYSTKLKHLPLIDVCCISAGFVLRAVGGAAAAHVPVSPWFLLCTSLGSLFLALDKRRQELVVMTGKAEQHRAALAEYTPEMLNRIESLILPSLLTCYAIYSFQSVHGPAMLLTVPFVVFGVMRYQLLSTSSTSTAAPDKVLLKDRPLQVTIVAWMLVAAGVVYDILPKAYESLIQATDNLVLFK
jgi:4-hydroxybenzoate polyprenyltransferase